MSASEAAPVFKDRNRWRQYSYLLQKHGVACRGRLPVLS